MTQLTGPAGHCSCRATGSDSRRSTAAHRQVRRTHRATLGLLSNPFPGHGLKRVRRERSPAPQPVLQRLSTKPRPCGDDLCEVSSGASSRLGTIRPVSTGPSPGPRGRHVSAQPVLRQCTVDTRVTAVWSDRWMAAPLSPLLESRAASRWPRVPRRGAIGSPSVGSGASARNAVDELASSSLDSVDPQDPPTL